MKLTSKNILALFLGDIGSRLFGFLATAYLARGEHGILLGQVKGGTGATPLAAVVATKKQLDLDMVELARVLAK